jgi:hypothetical protein
MQQNPEPSNGGGLEPKQAGPLAGVFATLLLDLGFWLVFVFAAFGGAPLGSGPGFAVGMTLGFVVVGAIVFWLARRRGYHEFSGGVISATCWGLVAIHR